MAKPRNYSLTDDQAGVYHIFSRTQDGLPPLNDVEREALTEMVRGLEAFHQLQLLTYCILPGQMHLLLKVPERPPGDAPGADEILAGMERVNEPQSVYLLRLKVEAMRKAGDEAGVEAWRQQQLQRRYSLSEFMKSLKQRFSMWYNRRRKRHGVLWSSRYKSLIVEEQPRALRTIAAYIDLSAVREGLTNDPGAYRWCGFAEAEMGRGPALEGILRVINPSAAAGSIDSPAYRRKLQSAALAEYRDILEGRHGPPPEGEGNESKRARERMPAEGALVTIDRAKLLKPVRQFIDGVVLGSRAFVDDWFERNRHIAGGQSRTGRKTGARYIGDGWRFLYTLRQLDQGKKKPDAETAGGAETAGTSEAAEDGSPVG